MTANKFAQLFDLPTYCQSINLPILKQVHDPVFGWFVVAEDGKVVNVFDLAEKPLELYEKYSRTDLCGNLIYSPRCDEIFRDSLNKMLSCTRVYRRSQECLKTAKMSYKQGRVLVRDCFAFNGYVDPAKLGFGYINNGMRVELAELKLTDSIVRTYPIVIPSFCAPGKVCAICQSVASVTLAPLHIWANEENGWQGNINGPICEDIEAALRYNGCTWDRKVDLWKDKLDIHPTSSPKFIAKVWQEANRLRSTNPELLQRLRGFDLQQFSMHLPFNMMLECERLLEKPLTEAWIDANKKSVNMGSFVVVQSNNTYQAFYPRHRQQEISNFTLELSDMIDGCITGHMLLHDAVIPIAVPIKTFSQPAALLHYLTETAMTYEVGLPYIAWQYCKEFVNILSKLHAHLRFSKSRQTTSRCKSEKAAVCSPEETSRPPFPEPSQSTNPE